jgi:hypothetical protein
MCSFSAILSNVDPEFGAIKALEIPNGYREEVLVIPIFRHWQQDWQVLVVFTISSEERTPIDCPTRNSQTRAKALSGQI